MALILADRVRETTHTAGLGAYALSGASGAFRSFAAAVGEGNTTYYCASDNVSRWEVGIGAVAGDTLARTTILASSSDGAAVDWPNGQKDVFCTAPATFISRISNIISVKDFGAVGDGVTDDTAAIQAAMEAAAARKQPLLIPDGTFLVKPGAGPVWYYPNIQSTTPIPVYRALKLDFDNLHLIGHGGRIVMGPGASAQVSGGRTYMLATDQNTTVGTVKNFILEGEVFDLDTTFTGSANTTNLNNPYMCGLIGVDGIRIQHALHRNSAGTGGVARMMHCYTVQNSINITLSDVEFEYVAQGINLSYCSDVRFSNIYARYFTEAIDIDHVCDRVTGHNFNMRDSTGNQSQCIDIADLRQGHFSGIVAENIAKSIFGVYWKPDSALSFADWLAHTNTVYVPATAAQVCENVTIEGIKGVNIGTDASNYPAIFVGIERDSANFDGKGNSKRITVRDVHLRDTSCITVREGVDVTLRDVVMENVRTGYSPDYAAVVFKQSSGASPAREDSVLSGTLENVTVINSDYDGISINGLSSGSVRNLKVSGYGVGAAPTEAFAELGLARGIRMRYVGRKTGRIDIANWEVVDTAAAGGATASIADDGGTIGAPIAKTLNNHGGHRLKGSATFTFGGAEVHRYLRPHAILRVGSFNLTNTTGNTSTNGGYSYLEVPLLTVSATDKLQLAWMSVTKLAAIASAPAGASVNLAFRRKKADGTLTAICSKVMTAPIAAATEILMGGLDAAESAGLLGPGEMLILTGTRDGTGTYGWGLDLSDLLVTLSWLTYETD